MEQRYLHDKAHEFIGLAGDIYGAILEDGYNWRAYAKRLDSNALFCTELERNGSERLRLAAVKMREVLADIQALAMCADQGRKWRRLRAKIDRDAETFQRIMNEEVTESYV